MQIIYRINKILNKKTNIFKQNLFSQPFFLLVRPLKIVYENKLERKLFILQIEKLVKLGFNNIEIPWQENSNWFNLMWHLRSQFPRLNLGSASNLNKKSIDDSLKLNLNFSMMRFWDRNLFNYSKSNNHLLIPGISTLKDLQEVISCDCNVIKIYPINKKEDSLKIDKFKKEITFIAAGGLSILDIQKYQLFGYKAIVIGEKGFNGKIFDKRIYDWADQNFK